MKSGLQTGVQSEVKRVASERTLSDASAEALAGRAGRAGPAGRRGFAWGRLARGLAVALLASSALGAGSGCAIHSLQAANRRLKESNDRLLSENHRMAQENAALQKEIEDYKRIGAAAPVPAVARDAGRPAPASIDARDLLLDDGDFEITETARGTQVRIPDRVFFALGQATLSEKGKRVLDQVARLIRDRPGRMVRVDGHTDDTPIRKVRHLYPTNWELSTARACTVVRYLVDNGRVESRRIFPAGFSHYRPVASGRTDGAKSQNRRVEITILNESV